MRETDPRAAVWVAIVARLALQTRTFTAIDATRHRFVKLAAILGSVHHPALLIATSLGPMRAICTSVSTAFADLLFGGVLTLVR